MGNVLDSVEKINDIDFKRPYDDIDVYFGGKEKPSHDEYINRHIIQAASYPLLQNTAHFYFPWNYTLGENWFTRQGGKCADFELDYYRCMSKTQQTRGYTRCRLYLEDLVECSSNCKKNERIFIMKKVRAKKRAEMMTAPDSAVVIMPPIE